LVPKLWKNIIWLLKVFWDSRQYYYEVKDDESQFDHWFGIFSVWSPNFGNLHSSPWTFKKIKVRSLVHFWTELMMIYVGNFSMVMYLQFGPPILVKLRFDPCFWKIVVLVPQLKRLNLVFFYALESFILCCFGLFF
jgi:hypothetical protein